MSPLVSGSDFSRGAREGRPQLVRHIGLLTYFFSTPSPVHFEKFPYISQVYSEKRYVWTEVQPDILLRGVHQCYKTGIID